jgi:hypothetical protein
VWCGVVYYQRRCTTLERKKVEAFELFLIPFPSAGGGTFPPCSFFFRTFLSCFLPAVFVSLKSELSAKSMICDRASLLSMWLLLRLLPSFSALGIFFALFVLFLSLLSSSREDCCRKDLRYRNESYYRQTHRHINRQTDW